MICSFVMWSSDPSILTIFVGVIVLIPHKLTKTYLATKPIIGEEFRHLTLIIEECFPLCFFDMDSSENGLCLQLAMSKKLNCILHIRGHRMFRTCSFLKGH